MKNILKNYNWEKLLSDLIVVMLSAGLTFLLTRLGSAELGELAPGVSGASAFIINNAKRVFC